MASGNYNMKNKKCCKYCNYPKFPRHLHLIKQVTQDGVIVRRSDDEIKRNRKLTLVIPYDGELVVWKR